MKDRTLRDVVHFHLNKFAADFKPSDVMSFDPHRAAQSLASNSELRRARFEDLVAHVQEWQSRRRDAMS